MALGAVGGELRASTRAMLAAVSILLGLAAPTLAQDEALRSYYTANGLLNRGLYEQAAAEYEAFLATDPAALEGATARYGLAVSLSQLGKPDEALAILASLDPPDEFPFRFESDFLHAQLLYGRGAFQDAGRLFGRLVRRSPDHPRAHEAAGLWIECLNREGDHRQAVEHAAELAGNADLAERDLGRAGLFAALSLSALGRDEPAAEMLLPLVARDDEIGRNAALSLAGLLIRLDRPKEAVPQYERLARLEDPRWSPPAMLGAARVWRAQGEAPKAVALLKALLERYPEADSAQEAQLELGISLIEAGDFNAGRDALPKAEDAGDDALASRSAYWHAKSLLREGKAAPAARQLESALKQFPESPIRPEMLYDLGVALNEAGEPEKAVEVFEQITSEHPGHRLATTAQLAAATTLLQLGRTDEARAAAARVGADTPDAPEAALILAEADALRGRHAQSVERLRQWMQAYPGHAASDRARYRLAMSLAALDERREAERVAEPLLDGKSVEARFTPGLLVLGDAAFRDEDWAGAERWFRRAVDLGATPAAHAQLKLGLALARQGENDEASQWFERAAAGEPGDDVTLQARFELGQAHLMAGRDDEAAQVFDSLLTDAPQSRLAGYAMRQLGGIAERRGDPGAAAGWYERAARSSKEIRAEVLRDQARAALAASDFDTPARLASGADDPDLSAYACIALARKGDHQQAIDALDRALGSGGLSDEVRRAALLERAWCSRRLGDDDSAAHTLRAILDENRPDRYSIYAALEAAALALDAERTDEAASLLEQAAALIAAQPAIVEPAMGEQLEYRLAALDSALGRHDAVIERLKEFEEHHPDSPLLNPANVLLGDAYVATDHPAQAVRAYERAAADAPEALQAPALLRLGDALARAGSWAKSREAFERYLAANADSPYAYEANFGLGWALEHEGEHAKAREAYARVVASHQGPTAGRAQFQIGECLFAEGRHEEAVRELLRVDILYDYPEWSAAALYEAGRAFEQLRKFGEARQQYRETLDRFPESDWGPLARERLERLASADRGE